MKEENGTGELVHAVLPTLEDEDITFIGYEAKSIIDKQLGLRTGVYAPDCDIRSSS